MNHNPPPCTDEDCHRRVCREARQENAKAQPAELESQRYNRADRRRIWRQRPARQHLAPHPLARW